MNIVGGLKLLEYHLFKTNQLQDSRLIIYTASFGHLNILTLTISLYEEYNEHTLYIIFIFLLSKLNHLQTKLGRNAFHLSDHITN